MQKESKTRDVVLIGPVLPYRGGIAQHTTMLKRELTKLCNLTTFSFKRQYPAILFPGESDKDPDYENFKEEGVDYAIDSLNPLSWRKVVKNCQAIQASAVIIPWWTFFWAPFTWYLLSNLKKLEIKTIVICHNAVEHDAKIWQIKLSKFVLSLADCIVVHTKEDERNINYLIDSKEVIRHPHPIYDQFPSAKGSLSKRCKLELLFFGFVRPYKGLDILIKALSTLKRKDFALTVVGEFWDGKSIIEKQINDLQFTGTIEIIPRYVSEQETAEYFNRADIVILPYRNATGSGVVTIAYHYNKPVIVTNVGGLPDVVLDGKTGYIIEANNPDDLAKTIENLSRSELDSMKKNIIDYKKQLTWNSFAQSILFEVFDAK